MQGTGGQGGIRRRWRTSRPGRSARGSRDLAAGKKERARSATARRRTRPPRRSWPPRCGRRLRPASGDEGAGRRAEVDELRARRSQHWADPLILIGDEWTNNDLAMHGAYWNWGNLLRPAPAVHGHLRLAGQGPRGDLAVAALRADRRRTATRSAATAGTSTTRSARSKTSSRSSGASCTSPATATTPCGGGGSDCGIGRREVTERTEA